MKNKFIKLLMITLSALLLLTGCGSDEDPDEPVEEETISVTVYNNSTHELTSLYVGSIDEDIISVDVLSEPIQPGESAEVSMPGYTGYIIEPSDSDDYWLGDDMKDYSWTLYDDSLIVVSDELYTDYFVFNGYTIEEALEEMKEEIIVVDPINSNTNTNTDDNVKDTTALAKELGYDSLEDMRLDKNEYVENYDDDTFGEISGYWYPDGDKNSLTYFKVSRGTIYWYTFQEGIGDVETSFDSIVTYAFGTYKTTSGNKLISKSEGLFSSYLLYNDSEVKYYHNDH